MRQVDVGTRSERAMSEHRFRAILNSECEQKGCLEEVSQILFTTVIYLPAQRLARAGARCPLPWPRRAASAAMLEVAASGGYRVSPRALTSADSSLWPCPYGLGRDRPRLAPGTTLYAVWTFLSDPFGSERPPCLQAFRSIPARRCRKPTQRRPMPMGSSAKQTVG